VKVLPNRIGDFGHCDVKHDQLIALNGDIRNEPLCLGRIGFRKDPLCNNAAIDNDVAHRSRSAAMSGVESGRWP
jgi:hypothetical protein